MSTLFWDIDDPENMSPRRALEVLWGDAMNHLKATDGEVFVPINIVDTLLGMEYLNEMASRLANLLAKEVLILLDESISCYRLVRKGIDANSSDEDLTASEISMGLDEHRSISKSIYRAGASFKISPRPEKVPRPPNCFILYRQANHHLVKTANPGVSNNEISRILGARWNNESPAVREQFTRLAEDLKREHAIKHPDYQYAPRRPSERRRRTPRNNTSSQDSFPDDPHYQEMVSQAEPGYNDEQILPVDESLMQILRDNGLLFGPNGVAPLEAIFDHNDHLQISTELASGSSFSTMDYLSDSLADDLNVNNDDQEMLVPNMI